MMKELMKKRQNNKGFSLVELIVVIAIMVVLVAVLAPVFTKYVESSRRATDIQNANSIASAVLADVADGKTIADGKVKVVADNPSAIKEEVKTKGNAVAKDENFYYQYNKTTNKCAVYVGETDTTDLTTEDGAQTYKNK